MSMRHLPRITQQSADDDAASDHQRCRNSATANRRDEASRQLRVLHRFQRRPRHWHLHDRIVARNGRVSDSGVTALGLHSYRRMTTLAAITDWFSEHEVLLWWVSAVSVALLLVSPVVAIWFVSRLPKNYFVQKHRP